jgi:hypothetical protein
MTPSGMVFAEYTSYTVVRLTPVRVYGLYETGPLLHGWTV